MNIYYAENKIIFWKLLKKIKLLKIIKKLIIFFGAPNLDFQGPSIAHKSFFII